MCSRDLPDMYALSPRALGIHIRQIPRAHVTTITCLLQVVSFIKGIVSEGLMLTEPRYKEKEML